MLFTLGVVPHAEEPVASRALTDDRPGPVHRQFSALAGEETPQTGKAPPVGTSRGAKEPSLPFLPRTRTLLCFLAAPLRGTNCRYAVESTSPGEAASSRLR